MSGTITRRGTHSWRLKFEGGERDAVTGKRRTRYVTVRGTKKDAQRELNRLLGEVDNGSAVNPLGVRVEEYLREWLDGSDHLGGKTRERYRALSEQQILPHLGGIILQN